MHEETIRSSRFIEVFKIINSQITIYQACEHSHRKISSETIQTDHFSQQRFSMKSDILIASNVNVYIQILFNKILWLSSQCEAQTPNVCGWWKRGKLSFSLFFFPFLSWLQYYLIRSSQSHSFSRRKWCLERLLSWNNLQ